MTETYQVPKQDMKRFYKLRELTSAAVMTAGVVALATLMSVKDKEYAQRNNIYAIAIKADGKYAFAGLKDKVPSTTEVVRQEAGQNIGEILGINAVTGG